MLANTSQKVKAQEASEEAGVIDEIGELKEVNMILGGRERVRHSGVIRPGIKVPVASATDQQKALYAKMYEEGEDFDVIDAAMLKAGSRTQQKSLLRPVNIDHFIIRDSDFSRPSDAEMIRQQYADEKGIVRRIPIWFPSNDIATAIPHNFVAFDGGHNVRCHSFYDGEDLKFRYLPKTFQGTAKPKDWLVLDTDDEHEATKACGYKVKFGGRYHFYIEGVKSVGEMILPTCSWYGLGDGVAVLRRIRTIYGRFSGLFDGRPFLELVKVKAKVKTPEGKRIDQWVVTVESTVDMIELQRYAENRPSRGVAALQLLNGGKSKSRESKPQIEPLKKEGDLADSSFAEEAVPQNPPTTTPGRSCPSMQSVDATLSAPMSSKQTEECASQLTELEKVKNDLSKHAMSRGVTTEELNAYAAFKLRQPLCDEQDCMRLHRLLKEMKCRLEANTEGFRSKCQELIAQERRNDPEIEGMWIEFERLADTYDLSLDHLKAHLVALTDGTTPDNMSHMQLQNAYREVDARLKRGSLDQFKNEIAGNFRACSRR